MIQKLFAVRFVTILVSLLPSSSFADSNLRILWWNIAGLINEAQILHTLEDISDDYDVILLGESRRKFINSFFKNSKNRKFSHIHEIEYPDNQSLHIHALSKYPVASIHKEVLDWGTPESKKLWRDKYLKTPYSPRRTLEVIQIKKANELYNLSPVHFLNPWHIVRKKEGLLRTTYAVLYGKNNPLYYQTQTAVQKLISWGITTSPVPYILIGDFNSPTNPMTGAALNYLKKYFKNLMLDNRITYAAQELKIDHAFGNHNVRVIHDEVLFFEGSDHYPIEIEINAHK